MWSQILIDAASTQRLGRFLGLAIRESAAVALIGELGAGKTCFAQGLGEGLGVDQPIVSPTFVLMAEYEGRLPLLHADVYRLGPSELAGIGLEEALEGWEGAALVEWADRFADLMPEDHLRIELTHHELGRRMRVTALGPVHAELLERWVQGAEQSSG
jgi:tRNA threonylcarbamoyladenosine biosynthesis protein TsaE